MSGDCVVTPALLELMHRLDYGAGASFAGLPGVLSRPKIRERFQIAAFNDDVIGLMSLTGQSFSEPEIRLLLKTGRPPVSDPEISAAEIRKILELSLISQPSSDPAKILTDCCLKPGISIPPALIDALRDRDRQSVSFVHPLIRCWLVEYEILRSSLSLAVALVVARAVGSGIMIGRGYEVFRFLPLSAIQVRLGIPANPPDSFSAFAESRAAILRSALEATFARSAEDDPAGDLERWPHVQSILNHRQCALLAHALRNPRHEYTLDLHRRTHGIAYATARADLYELHDRGFLNNRKRRKAWVFISPPDLGDRLTQADLRSPERREMEKIPPEPTAATGGTEEKKWYFW